MSGYVRSLREQVYFILLLSSNRKYDPIAIDYGLVMKQWYGLYVSLYSYRIFHSVFVTSQILF